MSLPFASKDDWRFRWLVFGKWERLHRVVAGKRSDERRFVGVHRGRTACGIKKAEMYMPGIFSRMGLPRCRPCCKKVGVPYGKGAPFNEGIDA